MGRTVAARAGIAPFYVMEVMKAAGERARAGGDVLHLEVGQPSTPAPAAVLDAAARLVRDDRLAYTDALGTRELRERLARWYDERYGIDVGADRIAIASGASGACVLAFLACFDVGARVAVAAPGYPCYRHMLTSLGIEAVEVPVDATTRLQLAPAALAEVAERVGPLDGVVVASPSNPTGTMLAADDLAALAAWCRDRDVRLVSDEIYHGITYGEAASTAIASDPEAVVVGSFSKYFSMTGWRLGWLVLPPELVTPVERLAQNLTVAPPTLAQLAGVHAFDAVAELDGHVARYARNRAVLLDGLVDAGFAPEQLAPSDGAFYLWADVGHLGLDSQALCARWLDELGVATTPGIDFDPGRGDRFVRFSFAGATDDVVEAMARLRSWAR